MHDLTDRMAKQTMATKWRYERAVSQAASGEQRSTNPRAEPPLLLETEVKRG